MSVASGVEFGDPCMAALGQPPQVIGNIETVIGCGTISRARGIAVQVMIGDPVCRDDVIETAADGLVEIAQTVQPFDRRLQELRDAGLIRDRDGGPRVTRRGRAVLVAFGWLGAGRA